MVNVPAAAQRGAAPARHSVKNCPLLRQRGKGAGGEFLSARALGEIGESARKAVRKNSGGGAKREEGDGGRSARKARNREGGVKAPPGKDERRRKRPENGKKPEEADSLPGPSHDPRGAGLGGAGAGRFARGFCHIEKTETL